MENISKILRKIEKYTPRSIYEFFQPAYHFLWAILARLVYGNPSKKLFVIAVTGTKGKSSTTEIINSVLEKAGYKTALSNTIRFKIGNKSRANVYKMSMPGRMFVQKFLRNAVKQGCTHAVLEMTSLGAKQFRHLWIGLDVLVFTNLAPEHIEAHGSFEKYREAKSSLVDFLGWGKNNPPTLITNADDISSVYFEKRAVQKNPKVEIVNYSLSEARPFTTTNRGTNLTYKSRLLTTPLVGEFNISNTLAGIKVAELLNISNTEIDSALAKIDPIKGRVEYIKAGQDFDVVVDYAHTTDSLKALYEAFGNKPKICVLGNTGGGRDTWKRPEMAKIANEFCEEIILTNEDPYDEDPMQIINEMKVAIDENKLTIEIDRREAIALALKKAKTGSVVLITGKGTDPYIMTANDTKIPWSDEKVATEELQKLIK